MEFNGPNNEYLQIVEIGADNCHLLNAYSTSELSILWFREDGNRIRIDSVEYELHANEIINLTEFHTIEPIETHGLFLIKWNRDFYCIVDHDSEVSCKGILYYGASNVPIIRPSAKEVEVFEALFRVFEMEMDSKDNLQLEMLQMLLKRLIILCTRIYKTQRMTEDNTHNLDIIREYNFLVEQHFRTKHAVSDYAAMLHRSPKTLSNLFKKHGETTPLKFIQNRIMLEARRLLMHSDQSVSEIGYTLGFSDVQVFSRFFRNQQGISPQKFKSGKIANSSGKAA